MKRTAILLLFALISGVSLAAALVLPASPGEHPEFYFTRLAYTQNGTHGWGYSLGPNFRCPEFGGGNFFPVQSTGWGMDYPGADCKFMGGVHRLTGLPVYPNPNVLGIMDDRLFEFPYAYIVEPGGLDLTDEEIIRLREYLHRGGFIHVDDFWGLDEKENLEQQLRLVLPDRHMEALPLTHPIFHTFFDIDEVMQIPGYGNACDGCRTWERSSDPEPRIYGISDEKGRVMVGVTYNSDLGDAWEYMDARDYPEKYSGQAYRLGINFMVYAMTH
jgi:hypothetical protein